MEAGFDWHDARTGRLWSIDVAGADANQFVVDLASCTCATFGFGSIVGMLLMSGLIGLPFALTSRKLTHLHQGIQTLAAVLSICFGIWYAYKAGSGVSWF